MPLQPKQQPPYYTQDTNIKTYKALITQLGTANPTTIILQNTIGNIIWTRFSPGEYDGTLIATFPIQKTSLIISPNSLAIFTLANAEDNEPSDKITINTYDITGTPSDDMLYYTTILIQIKNN